MTTSKGKGPNPLMGSKSHLPSSYSGPKLGRRRLDVVVLGIIEEGYSHATTMQKSKDRVLHQGRPSTRARLEQEGFEKKGSDVKREERGLSSDQTNNSNAGVVEGRYKFSEIRGFTQRKSMKTCPETELTSLEGKTQVVFRRREEPSTGTARGAEESRGPHAPIRGKKAIVDEGKMRKRPEREGDLQNQQPAAAQHRAAATPRARRGAKGKKIANAA